ncbi:MAG: HEAT repeat domain-containing protein [Deltaproteobacteria bacterium]|nr:HEAT repeat domain-containing protein [Deltaproteobacteria bacterium]
MSIFNLFNPDIRKLKAKKKVNSLIKALHYKKDCNVRKSAAEALEAIGWEPINGEGIYYLIALNDWKKLIHLGTSSVEPLLEVLQNENSSTLHRECIKALGEIRDKRAVEPLLEALQNKKISLREEAVKALGKIGDEKVVKPLISILQNEKSSKLRVQTIRALGSTKAKRAVESLIEALQREMQKPRSEANTGIIIEVAGALGKIKDERAITHLVSLYNEYTDYINKKMKNALLTINTERSKFYFAILNSDENELLEIDHAWDLAFESLYHENNWVRRQTIWALMTLKDYRAVEQIITTLNDKSLTVLCYSIYALGEIGDNRAVNPLIDILLKKDFSACTNADGSTFPEHSSDPRSEAAVSLGKIKDNRAIKALIRVMEEKGDDGLIDKSAWALSELGDKRAIESTYLA